MVEAGAGYGRWMVSAACALRMRRPGLPFYLVGIEAEPAHFEWMHKHFRDNGLEPSNHKLLRGAVDAMDGEVSFICGHDPAAWYGQYVIANGAMRVDDYKDAAPLPVKAYSINSLLRDLTRVDLMDFDIQGAEQRAIPSGISIMTEKVARVFVETHGPEIHEVVREAFRVHGWRSIHDYPNGSTADTPYGTVTFSGEGLQCWVNPNLLI